MAVPLWFIYPTAQLSGCYFVEFLNQTFSIKF